MKTDVVLKKFYPNEIVSFEQRYSSTQSFPIFRTQEVDYYEYNLNW